MRNRPLGVACCSQRVAIDVISRRMRPFAGNILCARVPKQLADLRPDCFYRRCIVSFIRGFTVRCTSYAQEMSIVIRRHARGARGEGERTLFVAASVEYRRYGAKQAGTSSHDESASNLLKAVLAVCRPSSFCPSVCQASSRSQQTRISRQSRQRLFSRRQMRRWPMADDVAIHDAEVPVPTIPTVLFPCLVDPAQPRLRGTCGRVIVCATGFRMGLGTTGMKRGGAVVWSEL